MASPFASGLQSGDVASPSGDPAQYPVLPHTYSASPSPTKSAPAQTPSHALHPASQADLLAGLGFGATDGLALNGASAGIPPSYSIEDLAALESAAASARQSYSMTNGSVPFGTDPAAVQLGGPPGPLPVPYGLTMDLDLGGFPSPQSAPTLNALTGTASAPRSPYVYYPPAIPTPPMHAVVQRHHPYAHPSHIRPPPPLPHSTSASALPLYFAAPTSSASPDSQVPPPLTTSQSMTFPTIAPLPHRVHSAPSHTLTLSTSSLNGDGRLHPISMAGDSDAGGRRFDGMTGMEDGMGGGAGYEPNWDPASLQSPQSAIPMSAREWEIERPSSASTIKTEDAQLPQQSAPTSYFDSTAFLPLQPPSYPPPSSLASVHSGCNSTHDSAVPAIALLRNRLPILEAALSVSASAPGEDEEEIWKGVTGAFEELKRVILSRMESRREVMAQRDGIKRSYAAMDMESSASGDRAISATKYLASQIHPPLIHSQSTPDVPLSALANVARAQAQLQASQLHLQQAQIQQAKAQHVQAQQAEAIARAEAQAQAESRARADAEARARAEGEARARAEAEARSRADLESRARAAAEEDARLQMEREVRGRAEEAARQDQHQQEQYQQQLRLQQAHLLHAQQQQQAIQQQQLLQQQAEATLLQQHQQQQHLQIQQQMEQAQLQHARDVVASAQALAQQQQQTQQQPVRYASPPHYPQPSYSVTTSPISAPPGTHILHNPHTPSPLSTVVPSRQGSSMGHQLSQPATPMTVGPAPVGLHYGSPPPALDMSMGAMMQMHLGGVYMPGVDAMEVLDSALGVNLASLEGLPHQSMPPAHLMSEAMQESWGNEHLDRADRASTSSPRPHCVSTLSPILGPGLSLASPPPAMPPARPARSRAASGSGYISTSGSRSRAASGSGFQSLIDSRSRAASSASSVFYSHEKETDDETDDLDQDAEMVLGKSTNSTGLLAGIEPELHARLDLIFVKFLCDICSDLDATDSKGDPIHQTLMAKKMEKLDASGDFRPFKFRIQAFTSAFQEKLAETIDDADVPLKKIRVYLWAQPFISRFNDDGKKSKSKGNHIWTIEAKRVADSEQNWEFREFGRCIKGVPAPFALVGQEWSWAPRIWDPQCSVVGIVPHFSSPNLPSWLSWKNNVLSGIPTEAEHGLAIAIVARASFTLASKPIEIESSFDLTVVYGDEEATLSSRHETGNLSNGSIMVSPVLGPPFDSPPTPDVPVLTSLLPALGLHHFDSPVSREDPMRMQMHAEQYHQFEGGIAPVYYHGAPPAELVAQALQAAHHERERSRMVDQTLSLAPSEVSTPLLGGAPLMGVEDFALNAKMHPLSNFTLDPSTLLHSLQTLPQ